MAYVHKSVNETSSMYLTNEKRYNYTTPKSFLEQIALYQNLLSKKNSELQAKIVRLENGLEKLKSTAQQVKILQLIVMIFINWKLTYKKNHEIMLDSRQFGVLFTLPLMCLNK